MFNSVLALHAGIQKEHETTPKKLFRVEPISIEEKLGSKARAL
jgi:hypothetical protein